MSRDAIFTNVDRPEFGARIRFRGAFWHVVGEWCYKKMYLLEPDLESEMTFNGETRIHRDVMAINERDLHDGMKGEDQPGRHTQ